MSFAHHELGCELVVCLDPAVQAQSCGFLWCATQESAIRFTQNLNYGWMISAGI
jgi:hypothetical protein